MSKFNSNKSDMLLVPNEETIENLAGGISYKLDEKFELTSLVLTSFIETKFYESANSQIHRIKKLIPKVGYEFAAKLALYARKEFNMRSSSHIIAGEIILSKYNFPGKRKFLRNIIVRPDDMSEIISYIEDRLPKRKNGKTKLPICLKIGFKKAFNKFDYYQMSKYKLNNKNWSLIDIVNMVGPVPSEKNEAALYDLTRDKMTPPETWEVKLSEAGKLGKTPEEVDSIKKEVWKDLLINRKLGYMALLRNLNNINKQAPEYLDIALEQLTDLVAIQNSKQLPFRFYSAYKTLYDSSLNTQKILKAISKALDISIRNVPSNFDNTLVVIDTSASMDRAVSDKSIISYIEIAALFASALAKKNNSDMMAFADYAEYINYNPDDSILTLIKNITAYNNRSKRGCGTNLQDIFAKANKSYDRIVIFSDMQTWINNEWHVYDWYGRNNTSSISVKYSNYKKKYNKEVWVYPIDLSGYGQGILPNRTHRVAPISGWSEKIFDIMQFVENNPEELINRIENVQLG